METKSMSRNQAIVAITLFTFGSSVVMGINSNAGQDIWIAILLASVLTVPLFLMYARILDNFPNKNLFEISEILFGKVFGKIVTVLLVWYSLYLAALVLRNYPSLRRCTMLETAGAHTDSACHNHRLPCQKRAGNRQVVGYYDSHCAARDWVYTDYFL